VPGVKEKSYLIDTYNTKYNKLGEWTPWKITNIDTATQIKNWITKVGIDKFAGVTVETNFNNNPTPYDTRVYHGFNFDEYTNFNEFGVLTENEQLTINNKIDSVTMYYAI